MFPIAIGEAMIAVAVVDVFWTITPHGPTPGLIVNRVTGRVWQVLLALHERRPRHRLLSAAGVALFGGTALVWVLLLWAGWTLVLCGAPEAVLDATTGAPADVPKRVYFAATVVFTTGTGDYVAGDGWHLVVAVASLTGLGIVTLSVSYLVPVISAATRRRRLARTLRHIGRTPEEVLDNARIGDRWELTSIVPSVAEDLADVAEAHLAYPVLHYLHSSDEAASLPLRVGVLFEASHRMLESDDLTDLERQRILLVVRSIDDLARTLLTERRDDPPDEADDHDSRDERRDRLLALARQDGWSVVAAP